MEVISLAAVQEKLTIENIIPQVRDALRTYSSGLASIPTTQHLEMPSGHGSIHLKSGIVHGLPICNVKITSIFPTGRVLGQSNHALASRILIFDITRGSQLAMIEDNGWIARASSAAASAIAADLFAKNATEVIGVIGTGAQARLQVKAILFILPTIRRILVWGRTESNVELYISELSKAHPDKIFEARHEVVDLMREAQVLVTATYSTVPLALGRSLPAGLLVLATGADSVHKREIELDLFCMADLVIVDSRQQNLVFGEIAHGIDNRSFSSNRIDAEIGEILNGLFSYGGKNRKDNERIICKLTGIAVQELFVCDFLLRQLGFQLPSRNARFPSIS